MKHFNVLLMVWAKSHDTVNKTTILKGIVVYGHCPVTKGVPAYIIRSVRKKKNLNSVRKKKKRSDNSIDKYSDKKELSKKNNKILDTVKEEDEEEAVGDDGHDDDSAMNCSGPQYLADLLTNYVPSR